MISRSHGFCKCVTAVTACDDENVILIRHNGFTTGGRRFGNTDQDALCPNINRSLQRILPPSSVPAARTAGRIACCCRGTRWDAPAAAPAPSNAANAVAFKPSSHRKTPCDRTRRAGSPASSNRRRKFRPVHQQPAAATQFRRGGCCFDRHRLIVQPWPGFLAGFAQTAIGG
jgi:hypothetical protein